ncbi:MAG: signal peptide peptidase SppA [Patescibacteria group bacterium]
MNKDKITSILKRSKILKIALIVFVVCTALYFWGEKTVNFIQQEDELAGLPCYKGEGIATIEIRGDITTYFVYASASDKSDETDKSDSSESDDAVSSEEVVACIDNIQKDDSMKGVIVEIDSPGGSPVASEEIMKALKRLSKPTAAVVRTGAVSGSYLIATATDRIFASEWSDIGSIGVTMSYLDNSQKNSDEGIIYQQLSAGKFKNTGDPDRPLTEEEKELLMRDVNLMQEAFIRNVATNRNLDIEKVKKLTDGSTMMGVAAKENGLIDEIGDANSAQSWLNDKIDAPQL